MDGMDYPDVSDFFALTVLFDFSFCLFVFDLSSFKLKFTENLDSDLNKCKFLLEPAQRTIVPTLAL